MQTATWPTNVWTKYCVNDLIEIVLKYRDDRPLGDSRAILRRAFDLGP